MPLEDIWATAVQNLERFLQEQPKIDGCVLLKCLMSNIVTSPYKPQQQHQVYDSTWTFVWKDKVTKNQSTYHAIALLYAERSIQKQWFCNKCPLTSSYMTITTANNVEGCNTLPLVLSLLAVNCKEHKNCMFQVCFFFMLYNNSHIQRQCQENVNTCSWKQNNSCNALKIF